MLALQCNNCFSLDMNYRVTWENDLVCNRCGKELPMGDALVYNVKNENESVINLSNNYWVSKDGKTHEFKDMSAEHLRNSIKLLKRTYTKEELKDSKLFIGLTQEYMLR